MSFTNWSIPGAEGEPILGNTHLPPGSESPGSESPGTGEAKGVLVICHGFKGYKDYGFFPVLAERAARAGLVAHRFNFSHSGMTNNIETFERPELFERDTWGLQISDLRSVIGAIRDGTLSGDGRSLPIVVYGHSRGGTTALLAVAQGLDVAGVVTAAAPDFCNNLDADQAAMLRRVGYLVSPSSRTGQDLRVGRAWLDEIEASPREFDPCGAIAAIACPVLLIHGEDDPTVPVARARSLQTASHGKAHLHVIPAADHTFNTKNPLTGDPPTATVHMIDATVAFALQCVAGSLRDPGR